MEQIQGKVASDTSQFFQAIAAVAVAVLVMFGIGGTIYNLVAPGKWLAQAFARSPTIGVVAMLTLLIIGLCVWLVRNMLPASDRGRYAECCAYGCALAGAVYVCRVFADGGL
jgi:hypothetical protein